MAPEERIKAHWVGVQRGGEHVRPRIEDALGAVAVMQVDIEDCHPRSLLAQRLGGDCRIVDEAEAAGDINKGMMAGRAAQRIGRRRARHHRFGSLDRAPGAPQRALPGFAGDRAGGVGHMVAGLTDRRGRIGAGSRDRMDVGDHFRRGALDTLPAAEDMLEKVEIFGCMHRGNRSKPVIAVVARSSNRQLLRRLTSVRPAPAFPGWVAEPRWRGTPWGRGAFAPRHRKPSSFVLRRIGKSEESLADDLLHLFVVRPGNAQPFIKGLARVSLSVSTDSLR